MQPSTQLQPHSSASVSNEEVRGIKQLLFKHESSNFHDSWAQGFYFDDTLAYGFYQD